MFSSEKKTTIVVVNVVVSGAEKLGRGELISAGHLGRLSRKNPGGDIT